jgi:hypothetical protein
VGLILDLDTGVKELAKMLKYCDDLIGRDRSGKRLFDVVQLPKKGRGLIARVEIPSNTCVLVEDCAFLRTAELMCVKCLKLGHNLASCPAEREVFASLNASFPGCSGLVSQFFCPQPTLQLVLACLEDGGKKVDDHVSRLYRACPKSYCDRICESDFVKLYHVREFCVVLFLLNIISSDLRAQYAHNDDSGRHGSFSSAFNVESQLQSQLHVFVLAWHDENDCENNAQYGGRRRALDYLHCDVSSQRAQTKDLVSALRFHLFLRVVF